LAHRQPRRHERGRDDDPIDSGEDMKATLNGIAAYYEIHGKEGAPWLTFSHSLACSVRMWDGQIAAFKDRYRILVYDTRGHGERIRTAETQGMQALVDATLGRWFTEPFRKNKPEIVKSIGALIAATPVAGYAGCCHAIAGLNTTARLKDIKGPVLAITGEQDAAAPGTRYIGEHVPGATLVVIPQAAHIANIEQPEAFNRALREF